MLKVWACGVVLFSFVSPGGAQIVQQTSDGPVATKGAGVLETLGQRVHQIAFEEAPLEQVTDWLANISGLNVTVRWQALEDFGIARDTPITIKARNLRLTTVLWMIMNEAGGPDVKLAYRAAETLLILSTAEDLSREMVLKVYDVGDLIMRIARFNNAAQINVAQLLGQANQTGSGNIVETESDPGGQTQEQDREGEIGRLIRLITDTVEPDTWAQNAGLGTISAWRNLLVVRNNLLVHQRLAGYLR
jgi:hypothetical protein